MQCTVQVQVIAARARRLRSSAFALSSAQTSLNRIMRRPLLNISRCRLEAIPPARPPVNGPWSQMPVHSPFLLPSNDATSVNLRCHRTYSMHLPHETIEETAEVHHAVSGLMQRRLAELLG